MSLPMRGQGCRTVGGRVTSLDGQCANQRPSPGQVAWGSPWMRYPNLEVGRLLSNFWAIREALQSYMSATLLSELAKTLHFTFFLREETSSKCGPFFPPLRNS